MRLFTVFMTVCIIVATNGNFACSADMARPNVLFIAIDDLNDWVGCLNGHPQAFTPNIDRLAARGVLFANAHCQTPLCNPSRSSVLTGLRPTTTGIYGLVPHFRKIERTKNSISLPQHFRLNGYHTTTNGKVHHDNVGKFLEEEFDVIGPRKAAPKPSKKFVDTPEKIAAVDWGTYPDRDEDTCDYEVVSAALAQLAAAPADKPFFISVGFRFPHFPCYAPPPWFEKIPADCAIPPYQADDRADVPFFAWVLNWDQYAPRLSWLKQSSQWHPLVRAYLASTAYMDSQLGRLVDAFAADPRGNNTIIVLWSDHGFHLGEKGITGKCSLWERSTRVPMIISAPQVNPGVCQEPVELLDIYPTLIDLCKLPAVDGLEGHSLTPQLQDPKTERKWPAITSHNQGNHAIRTRQWRFIQYRDGTRELYDMDKDPNEWTNLANDPTKVEIIAEHLKFIPKIDISPAPGSAVRVITLENDILKWDGKPVVPGDVE